MVIRRFAAAPACDAVPGMQARGAVLLMRHRARFCLRAPPLWPVPREGAVSRSCRSHARPPWRRMSFRQLTREYGVTATAVHTVMWLATLGATYGALANGERSAGGRRRTRSPSARSRPLAPPGVDVKSLIAKLDMVPGVDSSKINPDAGTFVAAYVVRVAATGVPVRPRTRRLRADCAFLADNFAFGPRARRPYADGDPGRGPGPRPHVSSLCQAFPLRQGATATRQPAPAGQPGRQGQVVEAPAAGVTPAADGLLVGTQRPGLC